MTREESLTIVEMILNHWRVEWDKDEISAFAHSIQNLNAETATSTVIRASKELTYPPRIAEFYELYRAEGRRLRPQLAEIEQQPTPIPSWVRRWICARYLFAHFGKARDMRRFPEQLDFGDLTVEQMPEGAWQEEADSLSDELLSKAWQQTKWPSRNTAAAGGVVDVLRSAEESAATAPTTSGS